MSSFLRLTLVLQLAFAVGGCGDPPVGGEARREQVQGLTVLRLAGTPQQVGYHHGRLLRPQVRALADWAERVLLARAADPQGRGEGGSRLEARRALELVATQVLARLPERLRQEYEGLAAGAGLPFGRLLSIEVLRESVQITANADTGLFGQVALDGKRHLLAWLGGQDMRRLGRELIVIERRLPGRATTRVLTWPGSLGALAGISSYGLGAIGLPRVVAPQERGFGREGIPTPLALRLALERARTVPDLVKTVPGTVGHAVGVLRAHAPPGAGDDHALYVAKSLAAEAPRLLAGRPFLALAPPPEAGGPTARMLSEAVEGERGGTSEERHAMLRTLAFGPRVDPPGHEIRISATATGLRLALWPAAHPAQRYEQTLAFAP